MRCALPLCSLLLPRSDSPHAFQNQITLEPLNALAYEPFTLPLSDTKEARFDGVALAEYLVTCRNFVNPLSRAVITREQCSALDGYLKRHRLGPPRVTKEFDDAKAALEAAAQANTAEALLAQRLATAEALLRSFYTHTRSGPSRDGRRHESSSHAASAPSFTPAFQSEGGLTVMDDDAGMRGFSRTDAVAVMAQRPRGAVLTTHHVPPPRVEHFPALPPPATAAQAPRPAPEAEDAPRARPSWWAHAAPSAPKAAPTPSAAGASAAGRAAQGGDDAREQRRKQLAAAFGVSNPETRPSSFASSSAEAFTAETLALARAEPDFVADVERRFEEAVRLNTRRVSLPPMPRSKRRLVHEVGAQWHVATHAYGEGSGRHIDLFLIPGLSGFPKRQLSDAAKLSPEAAAATGEKGSAGGQQEGGLMQLLFADVAAGVDISNVLAPWADDVAVVSCDPERCTAVATFTSEAAFADARARLGAGIRGRFAVKPPAGSQKASGASARVAAATRAREVDPWAESAAAQPQGQAVLGEPPASWEVLDEQAVTSGRVAPPQTAPVRSTNPWSALGGDEEESGSASDGE